VNVDVHAAIGRIVVGVVAVLTRVLDAIATKREEAVCATSVRGGVTVVRRSAGQNAVIALFAEGGLKDAVSARLEYAIAAASVSGYGVAVIAAFAGGNVRNAVAAFPVRAIRVARCRLAVVVAFFAHVGPTVRTGLVTQAISAASVSGYGVAVITGLDDRVDNAVSTRRERAIDVTSSRRDAGNRITLFSEERIDHPIAAAIRGQTIVRATVEVIRVAIVTNFPVRVDFAVTASRGRAIVVAAVAVLQVAVVALLGTISYGIAASLDARTVSKAKSIGCAVQGAIVADFTAGRAGGLWVDNAVTAYCGCAIGVTCCRREARAFTGFTRVAHAVATSLVARAISAASVSGYVVAVVADFSAGRDVFIRVYDAVPACRDRAINVTACRREASTVALFATFPSAIAASLEARTVSKA
jgi:hypothetical protein